MCPLWWTCSEALFTLSKRVVLPQVSMHSPRNKVWCCYKSDDFLKNTHNRHPTAHPWGWGVGCLLWVRSLILLYYSTLTIVLRYSISSHCNSFEYWAPVDEICLKIAHQNSSSGNGHQDDIPYLFPLCRECQVSHWKKHKQACDLLVNSLKSATEQLAKTEVSWSTLLANDRDIDKSAQ